MRKLSLFFILALACACNQDADPQKYNSFNGYWIVRTPDDATILAFKIGVDPNNQPVVESATVRHNGSDYNSQAIDTELIPVSPSVIESITFRTTQFVIRLEGLTVNADFTEMEIAHSYFTIDSVIRNFAAIKAERK